MSLIIRKLLRYSNIIQFCLLCILIVKYNILLWISIDVNNRFSFLVVDAAVYSSYIFSTFLRSIIIIYISSIIYFDIRFSFLEAHAFIVVYEKRDDEIEVIVIFY